MRVSSNMVNADFDEMIREFLPITSLGEEKPVFRLLELRKARVNARTVER